MYVAYRIAAILMTLSYLEGHFCCLWVFLLPYPVKRIICHLQYSPTAGPFQMRFIVQLCSSWQYFLWHRASRDPSTIAELPVFCTCNCSFRLDLLVGGYHLRRMDADKDGRLAYLLCQSCVVISSGGTENSMTTIVVLVNRNWNYNCVYAAYVFCENYCRRWSVAGHLAGFAARLSMCSLSTFSLHPPLSLHLPSLTLPPFNSSSLSPPC